MYSPSPIITLRLLLASSRKEPENHVSGDKVTADYTCMTILQQVLHTCTIVNVDLGLGRSTTCISSRHNQTRKSEDSRPKPDYM